MTKTFKGPDRFRKEGEWEQKHPEFKVVQIECHNGVNEIPEWGFWCRGEYYAMDRCRGCSNKRPVCCFCERKETRCGEYCSVHHKYIKSRCTNNLCPDFTRKAPLINYCPTCGRPLEEEADNE